MITYPYYGGDPSALDRHLCWSKLWSSCLKSELMVPALFPTYLNHIVYLLMILRSTLTPEDDYLQSRGYKKS